MKELQPVTLAETIKQTLSEKWLTPQQVHQQDRQTCWTTTLSLELFNLLLPLQSKTYQRLAKEWQLLMPNNINIPISDEGLIDLHFSKYFALGILFSVTEQNPYSILISTRYCSFYFKHSAFSLQIHHKLLQKGFHVR